MVEATPSDVRVEIDTGLSDPDIGDVLALVERDIDREYGSSPGFSDDQHRRDFEAALAALRIAQGNAADAQDRTASELSTGRTRVTYEASTVSRLQQAVRRRDPGDVFGHSATVTRNTDRHVSSTDT